MSKKEFWRMAHANGWVTTPMLRIAVKSESNPAGDITPSEFAEITGETF